MNLCAPQTFVRIDISDAPQIALIKQQRLDPGAAGSRLLHKFFNANFERVGAEGPQLFRERPCRQIGEAPKSPRIGITQLAIIVEQETGVGMFFPRLRRGIRSDLPSHPKMHEQRGRSRIAVRRGRTSAARGRKPQQHELAVALNGFDLPAGKMLFEGRRVIDEIRFPEPHGENPPPHNRSPQASRYCFDFRKFWHEGITIKIAHPLAATQSRNTIPSRSAISRIFSRHFFW